MTPAALPGDFIKRNPVSNLLMWTQRALVFVPDIEAQMRGVAPWWGLLPTIQQAAAYELWLTMTQRG